MVFDFLSIQFTTHALLSNVYYIGIHYFKNMCEVSFPPYHKITFKVGTYKL